MSEAVTTQTLELLTWVAALPRTYTGTIETWGSQCPRHPVWEDAIAAGLVEVARADVQLTPSGRAALESA